MMTIDKRRLYDQAADFFKLHGSVRMRISAHAAIDVCINAANHRLVISMIEGGIWLHPGFESRLDCIWDGQDPPIGQSDAHANNLLAAQFIDRKRDVHDVFIITAPPIEGWPHQKSRPTL